MPTKNELQILVEKALATAYDKKVRELAMAKIKRSEMQGRLEGLWDKLNEHLIKIVMWGDVPHWRKEVKAFAKSIGSTRYDTKGNPKPSKEDHLKFMDDYRNTIDGKAFFMGVLYVVKHDIIKKPKRSEEDAQKIVYELQMGFLESFMKKIPDDPDIVLDKVLDKYERFNYNEVYKKERTKKATRRKR